MFLTSQIFRKTYVQVKKSIDEWLRKVPETVISSKGLRDRKELNKGFSRASLR